MKIEIENIDKVLNDECMRKLLTLILKKTYRKSFMCYLTFDSKKLTKTLFNTSDYESVAENLLYIMDVLTSLRLKIPNVLLRVLFPAAFVNPQKCKIYFENSPGDPDWDTVVEYLNREYLNNEILN